MKSLNLRAIVSVVLWLLLTAAAAFAAAPEPGATEYTAVDFSKSGTAESFGMTEEKIDAALCAKFSGKGYSTKVATDRNDFTEYKH
jgi:hypothetical protein